MVHANIIETEGRFRAQQIRSVAAYRRRVSEARIRVPIEFRCAPEPVAIGLHYAEAGASSYSARRTMAPLLRARRILLPFDFSAASVCLLQWMTRIADETGAKLSVLHVVSPWVPPTGREAPYHFDANSERIETARALLRRLFRKTSRRLDTRSVHVVIGRPSDEIVRFTRLTQADLLVMVHHGRRRPKHLFRSATTERVARRAPCPVLALPEAVLPGNQEPGLTFPCYDWH
jgi:nucleotide-binding universal stress UspA family protein